MPRQSCRPAKQTYPPPRPLCLALALAFSLPLGAVPGIRTDGTMGSGGPATLSGPNYFIPQTLGKVSGNNLFHSFQYFSVGTGETATFQTSVTGNVITRVTGGSPSQINGLLALTAAGSSAPAFWFINPAGVVFGAGSSIFVPGAFHVSTADYVKFSDGRRFYADSSKSSSFSSAAPEQFGFLGTQRNTIELKEGAYLATTDGALSIVAGDIRVDNAVALSTHGDIRVVAVGATAREVALQGDPGTGAGRVVIGNGGDIASITNDAVNAGNITVRAGSLYIDGSDTHGTDSLAWTGIISETYGSGSAGKIDIAVANDTSILSGGAVASNTYGSGNAGPVKLSTNNLLIDRQLTGGAAYETAFMATGIFSEAKASSTGGNGGTLSVNVAGETIILNGGYIAADTYSSGNAGNVVLNTGTLYMNGYGNYAGTGISSIAQSGSTGNSGSLKVKATGDVQILAGANIWSDTYGDGNGGSISVQADSLYIDSLYTTTWTGISSDSVGAGKGGNVSVKIAGDINIRDGGAISSNAYGDGNAGNVDVFARNLSINRDESSNWTGIFSSTRYSATGDAGDVAVTVSGKTSLLSGGAISSDTYTSGNAGAISLTTGTLYINAYGSSAYDWRLGGTGVYSNAHEGSSGNAGTISVDVSGKLSVLQGGTISSDTGADGHAGSVYVHAGSLHMDGVTAWTSAGISSSARENSSGNAGNVVVDVDGSASILGSASITSNADIYVSGNAGTINFHSGSLVIDGRGDFTGISSDSSGFGHAGNVIVNVDGATIIRNGGVISSSTFYTGDAGNIRFNSGSLLIDRQNANPYTGILTTAASSSFGNAGDINVVVSKNINLVNGGIISSDVNAPGYSGNAGNISVHAGSLFIDAMNSGYDTGLASRISNGGSGNAGSVNVNVSGLTTIRRGGIISSDTWSDYGGSAGSVVVRSGSMLIDAANGYYWTGISSDTMYGDGGDAGNVSVKVDGLLTLTNQGVISSDTYGWGNAGTVNVTAGRINISGAGSTISSKAHESSSGNAGQVNVAVLDSLSLNSGSSINSDTLSIGNAGNVSISAGNAISLAGAASISSSTESDGRAGNVVIRARSMALDASTIGAYAGEYSSGQTGNVDIALTRSLSLVNASSITIANQAYSLAPDSILPSELRISAPSISIIDSAITASSTGNIAASNIDIRFGEWMFVDPSSISTAAAEGNGGSISIAGSGILWLDHSQITTSVSSLSNGNGGDINLSAPFLFMNSGFIQANTSAPAAFGGNINLNVQTLIPSGNNLLIGGSSLHSFNPALSGQNVIQAAAPDGVAGEIAIASPKLDVSGSLAGIRAQVIQQDAVGRNPCDAATGSSLTVKGRGGLAPSAQDLLRATPALALPAIPTAVPVAPTTAVISCRSS